MEGILSLFLILILAVHYSSSLPEQGTWVVDIDEKDHVKAFSKTMFKGTQISVSITCAVIQDVDIDVSWMLRRSPCAREFTGVTGIKGAGFYWSLDPIALRQLPYPEFEYLRKDHEVLKCTPNGHLFLEPFSYDKPKIMRQSTYKQGGNKAVENPASKDKGGVKKVAAVRKRRAAETATQPPKKNNTENANAVKTTVHALEKGADSSKVSTADIAGSITHFPESLDHSTLVKVWEDGTYLFILKFGALPKGLKLQVTVRMSQGDSYISPGDWPLLIFYGVMGLVYIFYGIFWFVMLARNWQDLLQVQFLISAVILLGMLEKALFFGEYENVNRTGHFVYGAVIFTGLVSCAKRALARVLVIVISLGYGIVKPRLGRAFHKVIIVGGVFFILASIEACLRAGAAEENRSHMIAIVPLAVTEAIICWWIFTSLLQTMRTLRMSKNVVKLSLYRHFTNTLILSVIASIAYMVWFLTQHRFTPCIKDWKELWMDEAYWHFLFSIILFIIMILWRPTVINQRYGLSPTLDAAEDDVENDIALSEAYDGMKMRSTKSQQMNGSSSIRDEQKADRDLKGVDAIIPSSLIDKLLSALHSDEEIMLNKF